MSKFNRLFLKMRLTYLNMYLEILTVPIFRDYFKLDKMKFFFAILHHYYHCCYYPLFLLLISYQEKFDIVLVDDQTMDFPLALIDAIQTKEAVSIVA